MNNILLFSILFILVVLSESGFVKMADELDKIQQDDEQDVTDTDSDSYGNDDYNPDFVTRSSVVNKARDINDKGFTKLDMLIRYGCWCFLDFDNDHGKGRGQPKDEFDRLCKILHDGYECAMIDGRTHNEDCEKPWAVDYFSAIGGSSFHDHYEACMFQNPLSDCATNVCAIEAEFIINILVATISGHTMDPNLKHDVFDPSAPGNCKDNSSPFNPQNANNSVGSSSGSSSSSSGGSSSSASSGSSSSGTSSGTSSGSSGSGIPVPNSTLPPVPASTNPPAPASTDNTGSSGSGTGTGSGSGSGSSAGTGSVPTVSTPSNDPWQWAPPTTGNTTPPKQCCGVYPYRKPYNTNKMACCGTKTYNTAFYDCCSDMSLKVACD